MWVKRIAGHDSGGDKYQIRISSVKPRSGGRDNGPSGISSKLAKWITTLSTRGPGNSVGYQQGRSRRWKKSKEAKQGLGEAGRDKVSVLQCLCLD